MNPKPERWTAERLRALGPTIDVPTAASILNISRGTAYELARRDALPCRVLSLGRRRVVVVASLLEALGYPPERPS